MTTLIGLDLEGRGATFVGGGLVTERRLTRLLAEGARVRVVAPAVTPRIAELATEGTIEWRGRRFRDEDLDDAWFVHTATGDPNVDSEVVLSCERRRIWCVNASRGTHGSARMAAQVLADDVLVGVVSDRGVDPRRSMAVSRVIADHLREGTLPTRRQRSRSVGSVHLVGGGPGPVDLLTVRARRLLASADVVVHDRLGPTDVLAELSPDVEVIDVGKRPGHHPVPQDEINAVLVDRALRGKEVVRLKGGDPFVYGRGGEEVLACMRAGVPVDVVPGVSSALAVPQSGGIPVTHRGTAGAVLIVNGQDPVTAATAAALRDESTTVVVLMGVSALPRFVARALDEGAPGGRPVAFIENGHTRDQRVIHSTLIQAHDDAAAHVLKNPAVIVIGEVARSGFLIPDARRAQEATTSA